MAELFHHYRGCLRAVSVAVVIWVTSGAAGAQSAADSPPDTWREPTLLRMLQPLAWANPSAEPPAPRAARIRLFGIEPAFLGDPIGLQTDDDPADDNPDRCPAGDGDADWASRLEVAIGIDNPFFDFRSPYDPGGVGYYKVYTQYQLLDSGTTACCLGLQAVAPAGLEEDGVSRGPTVLSPTLSWYKDLGNGAALQGFVCKHFRANSRWTDRIDENFRYGMAIQSPLAESSSDSFGCLHVFMAALGRYEAESFSGRQAGGNIEVLPGVHWQLRDNWWLSGGVILPVGPARYDGLWQLTCSWRF